MNKRQCRDQYLKIRRGLGKDIGKIITGKLTSLDIYKRAKCIFCYVSLPDEVNTWDLIHKMLSDGKAVTIPYCDTLKKEMSACIIKSMEDTKKGVYGIYEPKMPVAVTKSELDLVIVPGLAFSRDGTRLGYGGGYYDKYLIHLKGKAPIVGISYDELLTETLPRSTHDVAMDMIITEREEINLL